MVTRLIFTVLLLPFFLFSGEFTATVDRNQVYLGESFTLSLTLKDVSPRGVPTTSRLKKSFTINSEQQSSNTVMINGRVTSSTSWQLTLTPLAEGELVIPSMSVNTSDGTFATQTITITALKGISSKSSESSDIEGINFSAEVSNATPYKNEQIAYTARLTLKRNVADIQIHKFQMEDAIVDINGEPKVFEKVVNGIRAHIVEFNYLITPLKPGPLEIPPVVIDGGIPMRRRPNAGSLFDHDFDPVSIMQGFNQLKPFTLSTEKILLDVQPAVAGVTPWLPARSLQIEETFDSSQPLQVGSPLSRGFKISAEGVKSSHLPNLNESQSIGNTFKVYADNPELKDEVVSSRIKSLRKEHYTLVPQESGDLTLPKISVDWWDVVAKEKRTTTIPARTLDVLPSALIAQDTQVVQAFKEPVVLDQPVIAEKNYFLYAIIAGLACLLFVAIAFGILLQRKLLHLSGKGVDLKNKEKVEKAIKPKPPEIKADEKPSKKEKKEKLPDLNPT
jgi:hypothetical protein